VKFRKVLGDAFILNKNGVWVDIIYKIEGVINKKRCGRCPQVVG